VHSPPMRPLEDGEGARGSPSGCRGGRRGACGRRGDHEAVAVGKRQCWARGRGARSEARAGDGPCRILWRWDRGRVQEDAEGRWSARSFSHVFVGACAAAAPALVRCLAGWRARSRCRRVFEVGGRLWRRAGTVAGWLLAGGGAGERVQLPSGCKEARLAHGERRYEDKAGQARRAGDGEASSRLAAQSPRLVLAARSTRFGTACTVPRTLWCTQRASLSSTRRALLPTRPPLSFIASLSHCTARPGQALRQQPCPSTQRPSRSRASSQRVRPRSPPRLASLLVALDELTPPPPRDSPLWSASRRRQARTRRARSPSRGGPPQGRQGQDHRWRSWARRSRRSRGGQEAQAQQGGRRRRRRSSTGGQAGRSRRRAAGGARQRAAVPPRRARPSRRRGYVPLSFSSTSMHARPYMSR